MNRYDEIQATARNIAEATFDDPERRNRLADELIKLVTLVVSAVGKHVAVQGESDMNDAMDPESGSEEDRLESWIRCQVGEHMQSGASDMAKECSNPRVDLERWGDKGGWAAGEFWSREGRSWVLTPTNHAEVDEALDADSVFAKSYYVSSGRGTVVDGIKFGNGDVKTVARYGDTVVRSAAGHWSVTTAGPVRCRYVRSAAERIAMFPARCDQDAGHEHPHTG